MCIRDRPYEWFDRYAEMGFLGINISKKYGGLGLPNLDALLVLEEFAKVSSVVAWPIFESAVGPIKAIEHFANEDLKQRIIPEVCKGNLFVAVSMSEPHAGSALTEVLKNQRAGSRRLSVLVALHEAG